MKLFYLVDHYSSIGFFDTQAQTNIGNTLDCCEKVAVAISKLQLNVGRSVDRNWFFVSDATDQQT